jgi:hypothetical protein
MAQHLGRWANLDAFAACYVALTVPATMVDTALMSPVYHGALADNDAILGGNLAIEVTIDSRC